MSRTAIGTDAYCGAGPRMGEPRTRLNAAMVFGASVSKWLALAALVALLWVARGVLPPFIVAVILAYVLSPLVDELSLRTRVRRHFVALGVFVAVLLAFAGLLWLIGARLGAELRDI